MPRKLSLSSALVAVLATQPLAGCVKPSQHPSTAIEAVTVAVQVPVPCPALASLGPEPAYPDTDRAILEASNAAERALLYVTGRKLRIQRLAEYRAAAEACDF